MFGLSAASYAFVCNELRNEEQADPHLKCILDEHRERLWALFVYSLLFMICTVTSSLVCIGLAQYLTAPDLYRLQETEGSLLASYENSRFLSLSNLTFLNLLFTLIALVVMVCFNLNVFRRENKYSKIAKSIMQHAISRYTCPETAIELDAVYKISPQEELEKIHRLESLLERVLKNHESANVSYVPERRLEGLLRVILTRKLAVGFRADGGDTGRGKGAQMVTRRFLSEEKLGSYQTECRRQAESDYKHLKDNRDDSAERVPRNISFVDVYCDLIRYRDSRLIYERSSKSPTKGDGRYLRWSIKKRLLIFLLWEESLSNMDLSQVCLSGANLMRTKFTDSDLTGARLLGANCEEADFSGARMSGLYFADNDECEGQIAISCIDDEKQCWDPYKGKEKTSFHGATFTRADLSRAFLVAVQATPWESWPAEFPFGKEKRPRQAALYSLEDISFDYAKLFSSRFRDLSFDRSSLERAQIFNSIFFRCQARSTNFKGAVLTNSILFWCDFDCINAENAILAESVLLRCNFAGSRLEGASFTEANLIRCSFYGASCRNVSFRGIIQAPGKLDDMTKPAFLEQYKQAPPCDPEVLPCQLDFRFSTLSSTDFSEADLSRACFDNVLGSDCVFTKSTGTSIYAKDAFLASSIFNSAIFEKGLFQRTMFRHSIFIQTEFKDCIFEDVDFSQALFECGEAPCFQGGRLIRVKFCGAIGLSAACFENVELVECDFEDTGVEIAELKKTRNCHLIKRGGSTRWGPLSGVEASAPLKSGIFRSPF